MSIQANTRIFKDSILQVSDLADGWISTPKMTKVSGFGAPSTKIPVSTAASDIDEFRVGLSDQGDATFEYFLSLDDAFQQEMSTMRDDQETRSFQLILPEGTINTCSFDAYVVDSDSIDGGVNEVYKTKLVLCVVSEKVWAIPAV